MGLESKILSKEIQELLYDTEKTVGTAESCTGGRIAESIMSVPGASNYFKGGIICYTDDIKERLLGVSPELVREKTAVCEEVAREMVKGAIDILHVDYAVVATGVAGPGGGTPEIPVGTIWLGCGRKEDIRTYMLKEDFGRDINLSIATNQALHLLLDFLKEHLQEIAKIS